jgi:hypothetical protein
VKKDNKNFDDLETEEVEGQINSFLQKLLELEEEKDDEEVEYDEYEKVKKQLENYLTDAWLAIPKENGTLEIHDMNTCSNEKFFEWLCYVWPPCKTMNHKPEHYDKPEYRQGALATIVGYHRVAKFSKVGL